MAAAAAMAGLISRVRPEDEPWRPLKLRLEVDAHIWRPSSLSGFMARHMEQPGSRHWKPASTKISLSPTASACRCTSLEPGTTRALTRGEALRPLTRRATSWNSERRQLVHDPMKTTSLGMPAMGCPASRDMYSMASRIRGCSSAGKVSAAGMEWVTVKDWPGVMPQVTNGSNADPSNSTTSSYPASGSEAMLFQ